MPLYATCWVPSGRLTVVSEPTAPLGAPEMGAASGCQTCVQADPVQMNFPFSSPLSRYRVIPCGSVSTVAPRVAFEAVFTSAVPALTAEALDWEADVLALAVLEEEEPELYELLPQAARVSAAARLGRRHFAIGLIELLFGRESCGHEPATPPQDAQPAGILSLRRTRTIGSTGDGADRRERAAAHAAGNHPRFDPGGGHAGRPEARGGPRDGKPRPGLRRHRVEWRRRGRHAHLLRRPAGRPAGRLRPSVWPSPRREPRRAGRVRHPAGRWRGRERRGDLPSRLRRRCSGDPLVPVRRNRDRGGGGYQPR